ncbi:MAG: phosphogluconate dehydrogenase (NADP(+)-dependent, decarboxylating) [Candidatus Magasanikbacteria bacterium CG_4_9_14_0_2_um_filter_42_11]|uniref:6-phosphogluconate dehydrogenase, decarboxylating n=1 Tax=Candidatus Magasanikbacteria bacterium CG_4_9_14_0_2_um_filter_42_11 TaxID=1974643 RepID=A0A2M8F9B7_9BACT|nr:MAG: phosphogluconate dehydrogenase (NADP(+)-dependent, decarboxylating) [Candidatus Magasanikbacteria bacterium CG10_big_fil_rev_8_21_14_0_10_43_9]PIY92067.1 MAG: phosphogluconate dehydrogenase (NADP(+)-dependent, decarboxylating) [Candidatus Magasanikbacteria bacterium CG_4_10_14_0_8_um_filter_42_12]PJC52334.1 MAG: phosphogluconate dehydrogenase (NADP(+)-dependent, decarboxylating) [Candidatus Magasanikbacteria bacterium CG_4_9_14_0_2_um_filter_42_11]
MNRLSDIGLIGLGPMGQALAQNMEHHGFHVSVYNRTQSVTNTFLKEHEGNFLGFEQVSSFVRSIKRPRKIMLMIKDGKPVDLMINGLLSHLDKGDIIIDGGNSFYRDTERRTEIVKKRGILFIGTGVSGGEVGALNGPSLMPGGSKKAYASIKKIFEKIAAKDFKGNPCVTYIGDGGAGHYVKMVHNGIEYGIMQLMAETYQTLHTVFGMSAPEIGEVFHKFNKGKLESFLMDIAVPVLEEGCKPEDGHCLIYNILDKASNKGTGKWASIDALDRGVAVPTIAEAVFARYISTQKKERGALEKIYKTTYKKGKIAKSRFIRTLEDALYASIISVFAQGYDLIQTASAEEKWNIDMAEVSRVWEGGCIIRAKMLNMLHVAYSSHKKSDTHVFAVPTIAAIMKKHTPALRSLVAFTADAGIPNPAFASSLSYFESMIEDRLPANFIQGLRDYFGAHTYERIDQPGTFHTDWEHTAE